MNRVVIIAEIGECFNGDLKTAKKLIRAARCAGCDIVKFQTLDYENIADDDPEKDWFEKIALDPRKIRRLVYFAKKEGINILFTPENEKTSRWLLDEGLKDVKIASSSMDDLELMRFIDRNFKRVFISTGMATLKEVKRALDQFKRIRDIWIMHCVSEYPTGPLLSKRGLKALAHEDVRLNMMLMLKKMFPQYKVGYSDHTCGILAPVAAAALGAGVIEKHITFDRETPVKSFGSGKKYMGTDHVLSLQPAELKEMVENIREVEKMFGPGKWQRSEGEKILKKFLRSRFK